MIQSNSKTKPILRNLLISGSFALFSFAIIFVLFAYVLYRIPNYENLYACFPATVLITESMILAFFCRKVVGGQVLYTLASSTFVSILSIASAISFFSKVSSFPKLAAIHVVFIIGTVLLQMVLQKKKPVKKRKNNLPFTK